MSDLSYMGRLDRRLALIQDAWSFVGKGAPDEMWQRMLGRVPPAWRPGKARVHWCGIFYAWLLVRAEIGDWPRWRLGTGIEQYHLSRIEVPDVGDCALYNPPGGRIWHHAMVVGTRRLKGGSDRMVMIVAGNTGPAPGKVDANERALEDACAYYSIEDLL